MSKKEKKTPEKRTLQLKSTQASKTYKTPLLKGTGMKVNKGVSGETIETKIERILNNKEAIKDGAPLLYTERKEGVKAAMNIRTDRFEIAIDAMDKVTKSHEAKRGQGMQGPKKEEPKRDGGPESIQGKSPAGDTGGDSK